MCHHSEVTPGTCHHHIASAMARQPRHRQAYVTLPASLSEKLVWGHHAAWEGSRLPSATFVTGHEHRLLHAPFLPAQTHAMCQHVRLIRRLCMPAPCTRFDLAQRLTSLDTLKVSCILGHEGICPDPISNGICAGLKVVFRVTARDTVRRFAQSPNCVDHGSKQKILAHREGRTRSLQITAPPTVRV